MKSKQLVNNSHLFSSLSHARLDQSTGRKFRDCRTHNLEILITLKYIEDTASVISPGTSVHILAFTSLP